MTDVAARERAWHACKETNRENIFYEGWTACAAEQATELAHLRTVVERARVAVERYDNDGPMNVGASTAVEIIRAALATGPATEAGPCEFGPGCPACAEERGDNDAPPEAPRAAECTAEERAQELEAEVAVLNAALVEQSLRLARLGDDLAECTVHLRDKCREVERLARRAAKKGTEP